VVAGLGVSLLSSQFARDEEKTGQLKLVHIEGPELWRELGLIYQRDRSLPRAATAFVTLIRQRAAVAAAARATTQAKQTA
jgi:DNA-binding transcriptional LysR family regulator